MNCCYQCKSRQVGCHSTCETYITERKILDQKNLERRKAIEAENSYIDYCLSKSYALKKKRGKRK